jgi:hypothetical protein
MQVTLIKLSKFISSSTNVNQMLISYFPYITKPKGGYSTNNNYLNAVGILIKALGEW